MTFLWRGEDYAVRAESDVKDVLDDLPEILRDWIGQMIPLARNPLLMPVCLPTPGSGEGVAAPAALMGTPASPSESAATAAPPRVAAPSKVVDEIMRTKWTWPTDDASRGGGNLREMHALVHKMGRLLGKVEIRRGQLETLFGELRAPVAENGASKIEVPARGPEEKGTAPCHDDPGRTRLGVLGAPELSSLAEVIMVPRASNRPNLRRAWLVLASVSQARWRRENEVRRKRLRVEATRTVASLLKEFVDASIRTAFRREVAKRAEAATVIQRAWRKHRFWQRRQRGALKSALLLGKRGRHMMARAWLAFLLYTSSRQQREEKERRERRREQLQYRKQILAAALSHIMAVRIQTNFRRWVCRRRHLHLIHLRRTAAVALQTWFRCTVAKRETLRRRAERFAMLAAATSTGAHAPTFLLRRRADVGDEETSSGPSGELFQRRLASVLRIQAWYRGCIVRQLLRRGRAVTTVGAWIRGVQCRRRGREKSAARGIQTLWRAFQAQKRFHRCRHRREGSIRIESWARGVLARRRVTKMRDVRLRQLHEEVCTRGPQRRRAPTRDL